MRQEVLADGWVKQITVFDVDIDYWYYDLANDCYGCISYYKRGNPDGQNYFVNFKNERTSETSLGSSFRELIEAKEYAMSIIQVLGLGD